MSQTHTYIWVYNILYFISTYSRLGHSNSASVRSSDRGYRIPRVSLPSFPSSLSFSLYLSGSHGGRSARSERFETIDPPLPPALGFDMIPVRPTRLSKNIHKLRTKSTWNYAESQLIRRPDRHRPISRVTFRPLFLFFFFLFYRRIESKTRILGSERSPGLRTLPNDSSAQ